MKKIFSILIAMFIVNIASMAQEQVFSIGTNGDIVTKTRADGYVPTKLMCRLICNLPEYSIRIFNPLAYYC